MSAAVVVLLFSLIVKQLSFAAVNFCSAVSTTATVRAVVSVIRMMTMMTSMMMMMMMNPDPFYASSLSRVVYRRHSPYMNQPDYRIHELNKRLQSRPEVSVRARASRDVRAGAR